MEVNESHALPVSHETSALVPFVPPKGTSDNTIRVLEIGRVRAWSYRPIEAATEEGAKARRVLFGDGPWLQEPDQVRWRGPGGLERFLFRSVEGTWSGWVLIPERSSLYGAELPVKAIPVHGGVTAYIRQGSLLARPFEIVGFSTNHELDFAPTLLGPHVGPSHYRDVWYAATETMRLANALEAMAMGLHREAVG
jgi:hypothetical protein